MTAMLMTSDKRSITFVASNRARRYGLPVAANSATGFGRPSRYRRNSAPITIAGAFFYARSFRFYGGCAQDAFGRAGFLYLRSTTCARLHPFVGRERGSSQIDTELTMHALIPPAIAHCSPPHGTERPSEQTHHSPFASPVTTPTWPSLVPWSLPRVRNEYSRPHHPRNRPRHA